MAYTKKDGSMPFPQSIKDLAEYLSVNCNSTLEVHYTQGKDANAYTKEMFNEYKTSQKYKSTYKSTIPMDMIIRDLESKEKTNGNKPLTVGSDLYKVFIDQTTKTMRQYVEYFPKVYSGYILEITVSTCNYKDKLKSTLDDLMKKGAVKKVFYQDKITYLHCADSYAIGRILKDIQAKEVKTAIVPKPPTTTTTSSSSFVPYIDISIIQKDSNSIKRYNEFKFIIEPLLNKFSIDHNSSITITNITRTKEEQAYFMLGAMTPKKSKYNGTIYHFEDENYITIYSTESILIPLVSYMFRKYEALRDFDKESILNLLIVEIKNKRTEWTEEDQQFLKDFFTTLTDTIIGDKPLSQKELNKDKTSKNFQDFVNWIDEKKEYFNHIDKQDAIQVAVDITINRYNQELSESNLKSKLSQIISKLPKNHNIVQILSENKHIHMVVKKG